MKTTENNNELIAQFMGVVFHDDDNQYYSSDGLYIGTNLQYHTSWDWLMPVVMKCFDINAPDVYHHKLNDALLETNIDSLYRSVIEIIESRKS